MAVLATVTLAGASGLAEDNCVNTFSVGGITGGSSGVDHASLANALIDFYNAIPTGGTTTVANFISDAITRTTGACRVRLYDVTAFLAGGAYGSPFYEQAMTLGAPQASSQMPAEVALCVTLEAEGRASAPVETADGVDADSLRDRPKQRYTGRIYLGPLGPWAGDETANPNRPGSSFAATARLSIANLQADIQAINPGYALCVWSRKDAQMRAVDAVSTDDAWDVQRRRGQAPSARTRIAV